MPVVLWGVVTLFLVPPAAHATSDDDQHINQPANDTQAHPKPEALIGGRYWARQPIRIPFIIPYRDPPLPHTLYTHALDRIQNGKSASGGGERRQGHREDQRLEDPSVSRYVHSMTAEESWTLLGYPYSRYVCMCVIVCVFVYVCVCTCVIPSVMAAL